MVSDGWQQLFDLEAYIDIAILIVVMASIVYVNMQMIGRVYYTIFS